VARWQACAIWSGEKIFSIGDDFWVTDEQGNEAFLVDGKALRPRETFELKDPSGAVVATVRKRLLALRDSMDIERDAAVIATVKKAIISPLHHRSAVDLPGGGELEAVGNGMRHHAFSPAEYRPGRLPQALR
jgi:uncharacterized protein YxjI